MRKVFFMLLVIVMGLSAFSGCASLTGERVGEYVDDSNITTKVNGIIVNDPDAHYLKIDVTTTEGDVVLQGFINSRETEARLVEHIRKIRGVKSVRSLLRVEKRRD
ncbi:MAG: BON domain-containing protein [Candidatus Magnetominusculus sp. LBB02]|nr:BON domain-containing protein [Candidatus Magnetominusculus sp. LBB02]